MSEEYNTKLSREVKKVTRDDAYKAFYQVVLGLTLFLMLIGGYFPGLESNGLKMGLIIIFTLAVVDGYQFTSRALNLVKELDSHFRHSSASLYSARIEIAALKEENESLFFKLQSAENIIADLTREGPKNGRK